MKRGGANVAQDCALRVAGLCVLLILACVEGRALSGGARMSQLGHTSWKLQDGVLAGSPNAIAQTADGYLWIGTNNGLTRFDGVRFTAWEPPAGAAVPNLNIISLLGSSDGSLWIGTGAGIVRLKDGRVTTFREIRGRVDGITEDAEGNIWFVRARISDNKGPLCKVVAAGIQCFGTADGLAAPYGSAIAAAPGGYVWVGHGTGVSAWKPGSVRTSSVPALKPAEGLEGIGGIVAIDEHCALVGFNRAGAGGGLQRICDGQWKPFVAGGLDASKLQVATVRRGLDGTLWIGTISDGLYRVRSEEVEHFRSTDGLSSDGVQQTFEDREGTLWVATSQGLDRFRSLKVSTYTIAEGLNADVVQSVLASSTGRVWISNEGSLDSIYQGRITSLKTKDGLPGVRVTSLLEDHNGQLWVGVDNQLYVYERGLFSKIVPKGAATLGTVISLTEDTAHDVWAVTATPLSLVRVRDRKVVDQFFAAQQAPAGAVTADPHGGVFLALLDGRLGRFQDGKLETTTIWPSNPNRERLGSMLAQPDGSVWASSSAGLVLWKAGRAKIFAEKNGLPCSMVNAIVRARNGDLWLSQPCGFVRIPHDELEKAWEQNVNFKVEVIDVFDGAQSGRAVFAPAASASVDGKLWFGNESVLQEIDPEHLYHNDKIPPVHIEQIVADHRSYGSTDLLRFPVHTRDVEIDYTALSLAVPQKVRFQYMLEGWDKEWQNPGTRRQAFYTNLSPREYTFRVKASNEDGVWNDAGASVRFFIRPAFYQTGWFLVCVVLAVATALYFVYLIRVRHITAHVKAGMLERLAERERIARDLHDSFFQGIQGLLLRFNTGTAQLKADEPARSIFVDALQQSDRVMLEGRELVLDLRATSTDEMDLPSSLTEAGQEFKTLHPAEFVMVVTGQTRPLHPLCAEEMYRLAREALYNAFRHAHAAQIEVELNYDAGFLRLRVRDDGQGIDEEVLQAGARDGHWGLPGMQERAKRIGAKVSVWSRKGSGTEIEVVVPASIAYTGRGRTGVATWFHQVLKKFRPRTEGAHG